MKKGIFVFLFTFTVCAQLYADQPLLIDVKIIGASQSPLFEPQHFSFDLGQDYLLVISNEGSDSISFDFGDFGQKVMTRSMQGTSSMTQQSIVINPNSKVQWHFSPTTSGEYVYHAINTSLNSKGSAGKIVVNKSSQEIAKETASLAKAQQSATHKKAEHPKRF